MSTQPKPSPTAGMNIAQRILHVGGRNNAAGYVEFGSTQAVEALVRQVLRDLPAPTQQAQGAPIDLAEVDALLSEYRAASLEWHPAPMQADTRTRYTAAHDAIRARLLAAAPQAEPQQAEPTTWSRYVAGMVGAYLGWPLDDTRIEAVAGIIERRRWAQGGAKARTGDDTAIAVAAEREACAVAASEFLTRGRSPMGPAVASAIRNRDAASAGSEKS